MAILERRCEGWERWRFDQGERVWLVLGFRTVYVSCGANRRGREFSVFEADAYPDRGRAIFAAGPQEAVIQGWLLRKPRGFTFPMVRAEAL